MKNVQKFILTNFIWLRIRSMAQSKTVRGYVEYTRSLTPKYIWFKLNFIWNVGFYEACCYFIESLSLFYLELRP